MEEVEDGLGVHRWRRRQTGGVLWVRAMQQDNRRRYVGEEEVGEEQLLKSGDGLRAEDRAVVRREAGDEGLRQNA